MSENLKPLLHWWTEVTEVYEDESLVIITGRYNHGNDNAEGTKTLGMHYRHFPIFHNAHIAAMVVPNETGGYILSGKLQRARECGDLDAINKVVQAIKYLSTD